MPSSLPRKCTYRGDLWGDGVKEYGERLHPLGRKGLRWAWLPHCFPGWACCLCERKDEAGGTKLTDTLWNLLFFLVICVLENQEIFSAFSQFPRSQDFTLFLEFLEICYQVAVQHRRMLLWCQRSTWGICCGNSWCSYKVVHCRKAPETLTLLNKSPVSGSANANKNNSFRYLTQTEMKKIVIDVMRTMAGKIAEMMVVHELSLSVTLLPVQSLLIRQPLRMVLFI